MIKKLCITHSLSESGLLFANNVGGLINPSLAIHGNNEPFNNFGEIMLIKDPISFNPKEHRIFNADVYSPRMPVLIYKLEGHILKGINENYQEAANYYNIPEKLIREPYIEGGDNSRIEGGLIKAVDAFEKDLSMMLIYACENNIKFNIKRNEPVSPLNFLTLKDMVKIEQAINKKKETDILAFTTLLLLENVKKHVESIFEKFPIKSHEKYDEEFSIIYNDFKNNQCNESGLMRLGNFKKALNFIKENDLKGKKVNIGELNKTLSSKILANPKKVREYRSWLENQFKATIKDPYFIVSNKNSWNDRRVDGTLGNISRFMNKNVRNGESLTFKSGVGDLRSVVCKQFKNLKEVEKNIEKLITVEEFKSVGEKTSNDLLELIREMESGFKFSASGFLYNDACIDVLKQYAKKRDVGVIHNSFYFEAESMNIIKNKIDNLLDNLENMEAPYFEAKSKVIYNISDFSSAIVPKGTSKEVIDTLKKHKVKIVEYEIDSKLGKLAAINRDQNLLFGSGSNISLFNDKNEDKINYMKL